MKMLYIALYDRKRDIGVYKKISNQVSGFKKYGIDTKLIRLRQDAFSHLGGKIVNTKQYWNEINIREDIEALYIRYPQSNYEFIRFLKSVKNQNHKIKIIVEIPTYPYDKEVKLSLTSVKDKVFRPLLHNYVDRIVTYSDDNYIFGVKTIRAINGLDFSEFDERIVNESNNSINMIAVATMKDWHGYDRILEGLGIYYKNGGKREIKIHFVGEGPEIARYHSIVDKYKIKENVFFYGNKLGKDLDDIYNKCDLGLVAFGCHRKGLTRLSAIKSREYAAKGLPMLLSGYLDVFPANKYKFIYIAPENDTPINLEQVITWNDELYGENGENKSVISKYIREIGIKKCDSVVALKPICKYLGY